jgi:5-methylcytosine-specific restriction endonuclease McrA
MRYQRGLVMEHLFPKIAGKCACGCNKELPKGKRKWHSAECQERAYVRFAIVKGDNSIIRSELFKRDEGFCLNCGSQEHKWEADHILPVYMNGGACSLNNFQTLCPECHNDKTAIQSKESHRETISSQAASIA